MSKSDPEMEGAEENKIENVSKDESSSTVTSPTKENTDGDEPSPGPSKGKSSKSERVAKPKKADKDDDDGAVEMIRKYMADKLGFLDKKEDVKKKVLDEVSVDAVVRYIQSGECPRIVVMAGAGISTSAGIPDFRSPGSGLYDNLAKFKLPYPQAIFEIDYFTKSPEPFFELARQLFPGEHKPTPSHYFVRLLHEKGLLLRHYTQNIDGLEKVAGLPAEKVVEAHGTFYTSHCMDCGQEYLLDWIREKIMEVPVPKCEACSGVVKPDIVFFGESLPGRFFRLVSSDFPQATLLIIMGSSLVVQPFASLVDKVKSHVPRLLINREKAGHRDRIMSLLGMGGGLDLDSDKNYRDVAFLGDCDASCSQLAEKLGWAEDLKNLMESDS